MFVGSKDKDNYEYRFETSTLEEKKKLKLFISYSHRDNLEENPCIEEFKNHIAPLKNNDLIEDWYDREIFQVKTIKVKLIII